MVNTLWGLVGLVAAIWIIYDVFAVQKKMKQSHKIIWTVCAIIFNVITAIVYFLIVKRK